MSNQHSYRYHLVNAWLTPYDGAEWSSMGMGQSVYQNTTSEKTRWRAAIKGNFKRYRCHIFVRFDTAGNATVRIDDIKCDGTTNVSHDVLESFPISYSCFTGDWETVPSDPFMVGGYMLYSNQPFHVMGVVVELDRESA